MADQSYTSTGRLDPDGDPIFRAPDGALWAVARSVGSVTEILARLQGGPPIPWSQRERVGHADDWVVSARAGASAETPWEDLLAWCAERLERVNEKVMYHDWERGPDFVFRGRLDETRARVIGAALEENGELEVVVQPVLAHLEEA